jgi:hypothetical protein
MATKFKVFSKDNFLKFMQKCRLRETKLIYTKKWYNFWHVNQ